MYANLHTLGTLYWRLFLSYMQIVRNAEMSSGAQSVEEIKYTTHNHLHFQKTQHLSTPNFRLQQHQHQKKQYCITIIITITTIAS